MKTFPNPWKLIVMLAGMTIVFASPIQADELPPLKVAYSADQTIISGESSQRSRLYAAPGKTRLEATQKATKQIILILRDKSETYMIMPDMGMYMKVPPRLSPPDIRHDSKFTQVKPMGIEKVAGMEATKYQVKGKRSDGMEFEGFWWITQEGIGIKSELETKTSKSKKKITVELSNVHIGNVEPSMFEVPKGLTEAPGPSVPSGSVK